MSIAALTTKTSKRLWFLVKKT